MSCHPSRSEGSHQIEDAKEDFRKRSNVISQTFFLKKIVKYTETKNLPPHEFKRLCGVHLETFNEMVLVVKNYIYEHNNVQITSLHKTFFTLEI